MKTDSPVESLSEIALASLEVGRLLLQSGASSHLTEARVSETARGLGADNVELRIGFASIGITIFKDAHAITRMHTVGPHGVNHRLAHALHLLVNRVWSGNLRAHQTREALAHLAKSTPRYPIWTVAIAVGLACAGFGRLLGTDWPSFVPIVAAAAIGQTIRAFLLPRLNVFLTVAIVAFVASLLAALGARWCHSSTITLAMTASVLLLVPGVPALNAQTDVLRGRPTLGMARAMTVAYILIFATLGLGLARMALHLENL